MMSTKLKIVLNVIKKNKINKYSILKFINITLLSHVNSFTINTHPFHKYGHCWLRWHYAIDVDDNNDNYMIF